MKYFYISWLFLLPPVLYAAPYTDPETETGQPAWEWQGEGIKLQQVQRIPDQTRAFYLGRGFSREAVERLAGACVFQMIIYNTGVEPITIDLADWRFGTEQKTLKLAADWQKELKDSPEDALIALHWSLFPATQEFAPGDWAMGMVTYPAAAGGTFNVHFVWHSNGERRDGTLAGLRCAEDKPITPGEKP